MYKQNLYDAFSGLSSSKKNAIVKFLQEHLESSWVDNTAILKAVEYATKEVPSFGGFILTAEDDKEIVATLIVNKTGLSGIMPEYLAVLKATKPVAKVKAIARKLEAKAVSLAKGDISILVMDFGPKELMLENITPQAKFRPIKANKDKKTKAATA